MSPMLPPQASCPGPQSSSLSPFRFLVNAGPTREYFDSVRFISNPSTGQQGYAIARVAAERGHRVVLVSGPVQLADVPGVEMIRVTTAAEMAAACKREFEDCDAAILTAAVCDYRPPQREPLKIKKTGEAISVALEPTEDIAAALGKAKGGRILIGFAMDDHDARASAESKLIRKNCDAVVQNGPENIGAERVSVQVLWRGSGWQSPREGSKAEIAAYLISMVESMIGNRVS